MNVDSIFTIGKTHKVCQDYTASGYYASNPFIIVSDGCSSSPDTDFGARLLTRVCAATYTDNKEIDPDEMIMETQEMGRLLGLDPLSLDATLLCATHKDGVCDVQMFGDGVLVKTRQDGVHEVTTVEYVSGAPFYLNYGLNLQRKAGFIEKFGLKKKVTSYSLGPGNLIKNCEVKEDSDPKHYSERASASPYKAISLMSDGALSFYYLLNTGTSKLQVPVHLADILTQLIAFKGYQGEFVQRRVQRFKKDMDKNEWQHADDMSLATIALGENDD